MRKSLVAVLVAAVLGFGAAHLRAAPPAAASAATVEYAVFPAADRNLPDSFTKQLNDLAAERWEFVGWAGVSPNIIVKRAK
jgi:hypothetical protein